MTRNNQHLLLDLTLNPFAQWVSQMTLNYLMVRFQYCWSFGEYGAPLHYHCSQVHSGPIYGLNRTNAINWTVWLNWIAWNSILFYSILVFLTIKLYLHLNCVLILNWVVWNWTVFDIEIELTLNWIDIYKTVLTFYCVNKICSYNKLK